MTANHEERNEDSDPVKLTLDEAKQVLGLPKTPCRLSLGNGLTVLGSSEAISAVKQLTESQGYGDIISDGRMDPR